MKVDIFHTDKKYQIIYADPPWDYGGKMQYDKTTIKDENVGFEKNIFIGGGEFERTFTKVTIVSAV